MDCIIHEVTKSWIRLSDFQFHFNVIIITMLHQIKTKALVTIGEIQPVHSEGDQPWDFFGRNDAKAEAPVLWPPHEKS